MPTAYRTEEEYYAPPRRARRRRRRGRRLILWLLLAALLAGAWQLYTRLPGLFAPALPMENVVTDFPFDAEALAARITPEMALGELGESQAAQLREKAAAEPDHAEAIDFIAAHIDLYTQEAVNNVLMAPEKAAFVALAPFMGETAAPSGAALRAEKGVVPYLLQYDSRWAYHAYGSSVMGYTACGTTSLAMAAIALTGNAAYTPDYVSDWAEQHGYYVPGAGTAWALFTEGAGAFGLAGEAVPVDREALEARLEAGEVLIVSLLPGDFTMYGHIAVLERVGLLDCRVYDPSSVARSERLWSWERLAPQLAQVWAMREA